MLFGLARKEGHFHTRRFGLSLRDIRLNGLAFVLHLTTSVTLPRRHGRLPRRAKWGSLETSSLTPICALPKNTTIAPGVSKQAGHTAAPLPN